MAKRIILLLILACALVGCGSKKKPYTVGVDPTWFPLDLMGKEANMFAFSNELLLEISRLEAVKFERVNMSWDNLTLGLKEGKYDAILSSLHPYIFELRKYNFSDIYMNTGPVLLIKEGSDIDVTGAMRGKEVSVGSKANEALFIRLYPEVIIRYYSTIPEALNSLVGEYVDGIVINYIPATAFTHDLYQGKVKIATPPLDDSGLRLITMHGTNEELTEAFNRGLEKIRSNGTYEKMIKKWDLD